MEALVTTIRLIHISAGTIALFLAPLAMLTVKGGRAHRRWGKIYFWAMAVVAATAVFSFYMAFTGYRTLSRKRPAQGERAAALDWTAALVTFTVSGTMTVLGLIRPSAAWQRLGIVPVVFGILGMVLAGIDIKRFARPPADRNAWWSAHMGGMLGSYIATVSAFSVVNFTFLPTAVRWLWPTAIGTPLIALWITYYRIRFSRASTARVETAA